MIPAADLALLYDDFTVTATVGSTSAAVHFRNGDDYQLGGDRLVREITMRYRRASFATLARADVVTINATAYRVLEIRQLASGDECVARLSTS